jgi:dihydroorotate dehydrogenase (NAD+) catalytic subunit
MRQVQLYDDRLDFLQNKLNGPFGDYSNNKNVYVNIGEPRYDFFGTPVYSPFGIAAGPLPTTRHIRAALNMGFDIVTLKSVRTDIFPLNKYPQVRPIKFTGDYNNDNPIVLASKYTMPLAVANSFGIPSVKPTEWQKDMSEIIKIPAKGQALLVAFQGTAHGRGKEDFVQDHVTGVDLVRAAAPNAVIEINLSCPNEDNSDNVSLRETIKSDLACFDTNITLRIVKEIRDANPDLKFIIKLAYFSDSEQLRDLIRKVGSIVDGISAINTMAATVVQEDGSIAFPDRVKAGISGAPIKWAGLKMTRLLKQFRDEFDYSYKILGMGGVLSAKDFQDYMNEGADIVMSVTGAMWDPDLAIKIKNSLE